MFSIVTVCTGNICRSPMAEALLRSELTDAGLAQRVRVSSAGVSDEEHGNPVDPRARTVLNRDQLQRRLPTDDARKVRLMRSFDPAVADSQADLDIADPWYGGSDDFDTAWEQITATTPGVVSWVEDRIDAR